MRGLPCPYRKAARARGAQPHALNSGPGSRSGLRTDVLAIFRELPWHRPIAPPPRRAPAPQLQDPRCQSGRLAIPLEKSERRASGLAAVSLTLGAGHHHPSVSNFRQ